MFITNTHKIGYPSVLLFLYYKSRFGQRKKMKWIFFIITITTTTTTRLESDRNMDIHIEIFVDNKV